MEKQLVHKRENLLFGILLAASILIYVLLIISIAGILIVLGLALVLIFTNGIANAYIRLNGVQLSARQFPELDQKVEDLCSKMGLTNKPEVYIMESGGMLNAFATKAAGLLGKNMVVLYSDFVDLQYQDSSFDIDFIIAHELAHLKRNHILKNLLILPGMWIPFLGFAYSRMCEYTCDRMAAYYTGKPDNAVHSLLVLAAGKTLYRNVDIEEYLHQYNTKKGIFVTLAELYSTHPALPKRIHALEDYLFDTPVAPMVKRTGSIVLVFVVLGFGSVLVMGGLVLASYFAYTNASNFSSGSAIYSNTDDRDDSFDGNDLTEESYSDLSDLDSSLMAAIEYGEVTEIEQLLEEGADPNTIDEYGNSALTLAVASYRIDVISLLLNYGADPDLKDANDWTPLMAAVYVEDIEMCQILLDAGADPTITDQDGFTAVDIAESYNYSEFLELVENY